MPIQVQCPHCRSLCQVGDQFLGAMVNCGRCSKPFKASTPAPAVVPQPARPGAAPAGIFEPQPNVKETLKGVFKAIMPFSKIEGQGGVVVQPAGPRPPMPAAPQPAIAANRAPDDDDIGFEFSPAAEAALRGSASPVIPSPPPGAHQPAVANWTAPTAIGVCRLDAGGATSVGMVRKRNEDSFLIHRLAWANLDQRNELMVAVVADGLGGHDAGDRASHITIQMIGAGLTPTLVGAMNGQIKEGSASALAPPLEAAIKAANQQVYRRSQSDAGCRGMGATCSAVLIWNGQVVIGHVGDTRVYVIRGGKATQLTRDQTLVERMVQMGQLTPQQAAVHPARNEVAQAIGRQPEVEPAISQFKMIPSDWLIIACDGLHAHVDLALLEKTVRESPASATLLAHRLVQLTNDRGGTDNCTVVAVHCY